MWSLYTEAAEYSEVTGSGLNMITFVMLSSSLASFGDDSNNTSCWKSRICKKCRCFGVCFHPQMRLRADVIKDFTQ